MKSYFLPKELRKELKEIWGIPIFGDKNTVQRRFSRIVQKQKFKKIITVGDYCSLYLPSDIKIFDGKVKRKKIKKFLPFSLTCKNPKGTIQAKCWPIIKKAIKEKKNVFVEGEEDLLVIPCGLLAEKNTAIIYGLPGKGICIVKNSLRTKKIFKELLKQFKLTNSL